MNKKKRTIIAALLSLALIGGLATMAYLIDKEGWLTNEFLKGKKYTLTYHANTGDLTEDQKVKNMPPQQKEYGDGNTDIDFTVSTAKPTRSGMVFMGWFDTTTPTFDDIKYGEGGKTIYTADKAQYNSHLYAKWEGGYTLIYDANRPKGAKGNDAPAVVTRVSNASSETFEIADPGNMNWIIEVDGVETDEYRIFLGWSEDKNAKEPTYTKDGKLAYPNAAGDYDKDKVDGFDSTITIDAAETPSKTKTLYAVWANKYVLEYKPHPEMKNPAVGDVFPLTQTRVTVEASHQFTIPDESDKIRPTRGGGYKWGWWGDTLDRFGYAKDEPSSAPVNEGCYIFGEPIRALPKDSPKQVLYAYFQPPNDVKINYDKNQTNSTMPQYVDRNSEATDIPDPDYGYVTGEIYYYPVGGLSKNVPKHPRYVFQGWATTPNSTTPEYFPGDESYRVNIVLNNEVTLYAVWKAGHNYRLYFNDNASGQRRIYYKNQIGTWTNGGTTVNFNSDDSNEDAVIFNKAPLEYFTDQSYTFTKDFFGDRGVFATREDTNSANGAWTYKFLGWSWKKMDPVLNPEDIEEDINYPVTPPGAADPENPNPLIPDLDSITGDIGIIKEAIKLDEPNASCNTPTTHSYILYAVWQKSPKHQLHLSFNKGGASNNLSSNDYYAPSSSGYVASEDLTEKTWTAENLAGLTVPTKNDEDTATYEFIGWSKKNLTGGVGTQDDVDVTIDSSTKKINQSITVKEPKDNPRECDGGRHTDTYYPVFKKTARHKFVVDYDVNAPSTANTVETHVYTSDTPDDANSWTKKKVKGGSPVTGDINATGNLDSVIKTLDEDSYTYAMNGKGWYATCVNTSPNATSTYTFLGWSTVKHGLVKENPGEGEFDPNDPSTYEEGEEYFPVTPNGALSADLTMDETKVDPACSKDDNMGNVHKRTLYGVWAGEPLHQFSVVFMANADGAPNQKVLHGSKVQWAAGNPDSSSESIAKDVEDFTGTDLDANDDGKLDVAVNNTWRAYSDALPMPTQTSDPQYSKSFKFDKEYWGEDGKDIIVKASADDSNGMRYVFDGWNTKADGTGTDIEVDSDGYITTPLEIVSEEYPCDSKTHHIVLYAKWKKTQLHNFQLLFYAKGGNGLTVGDPPIKYSYSRKKADIVGVMNPENLPNETYLYYTGLTSTEKNVANSQLFHTWSTTDLQRLKATATHANTTESGVQYRWVFKGWADTPDGPVQYAVDENGYLTSDITITAPHTGDEDCDSYTHTKVLYAIWDKVVIPKEHRFAITFDLNSGNNFRRYNSASNQWENNSTRTFYYPESGYEVIEGGATEHEWTVNALNNLGIGGATRNADNRWTYEFVGWSTEKVAASENPDMSNAIAWQQDSSGGNGDGFVKQALTASCDDPPANHDAQQTTHTKTLYAIWKCTPKSKTYTLTFYGNQGDTPGPVENVPGAITETETYDNNTPDKWNTHTFDITGTSRPTNGGLVFAGWSENKDDSKGKYGVPYTGENLDERALTANLTPLFITSPAVADSVTTVDKELYAIWLYEYRITYNANGGSNAPPHVHAYDKKNQKTTELRNVKPMREGHTFVEWNTASDGSGQSYQPGQKITLQAEQNGKKIITLYAIWN